jgi:hypothetical protein
MTPDPVARICAVLLGTATLPDGDAREPFLALARRHRVDRLVAWQTKQIDDALRVEIVLDELCVRELNRVLAALEDHGVFPLVFKGAAIAHTHYEASWLRPRVDADLLIPPDQRERAFDVLHGLGYLRPPFTSGSLVAYQAPFVRTGRFGEDHALDVHWRVSNAQAAASILRYDELASRASAITVRGQTMRTPTAEDALLLACVHRVVHHDNADDLLWVYDIHLLAERLTLPEWRALADTASSRGVKALCAAGLSLSSDRFGTAIPAEIMSRLTSPSGVRERAAVYLRTGLRPIDRLMVDLAALGPRAGISLVWEHVAPPARYVEEKYGVRYRALLPAFYVRRAVVGVSRWLARGQNI